MKKILATPKAKQYAKEHHLPLDMIKGSGEYGSIVCSDLLHAKPQQKITSVAKKMAAYYNIDLSNIPSGEKTLTKDDILKYVNIAEIKPLSVKRKTIASNILQSINNSAQYTLFAEMDTTILHQFYLKKKNEFLTSNSMKLTFTDILICAVSKALMNSKKLNSSLLGDKLYIYNYVNISLAVAHEEGLMTPIIKGANLMRLEQITQARADIVRRTKDQQLSAEDMSGGTFTISNLGNSFVTYFTPILNYPQSAILGVGKTEKKPVVVEERIVIRDITYFSLTMDHLILDGKDGDDFFISFHKVISDPEHYIF